MQPRCTEQTSHLHSPLDGQAVAELWNFFFPPVTIKDGFWKDGEQRQRTHGNVVQPSEGPAGGKNKKYVEKNPNKARDPGSRPSHFSLSLQPHTTATATKCMLPSKNHRCQKLHTVAGQPAALVADLDW